MRLVIFCYLCTDNKAIPPNNAYLKNMKRHLLFWLLATCSLCSQTFADEIITFGGTEYVDGIAYSVSFGFYDTDEDKESRPLYAELSGIERDNSSTAISVPAEVTIKYGKNYYTIPVRGVVGMSSSIQSLSLPESIQYIVDGAFWNCKNLAEINIPNSVSYIGSSAFAKCESLESITLPALVDCIAAELFVDCKKLKHVYFNGTIKYINNNAFRGCKMLTDIELPEGLMQIASNAFYGSGLRKITIPSTLTEAFSDAFKGCDSLKYVEVNCPTCPVFQSLPSLETAVLSNEVKIIAESSFFDCTKLNQIVFGDNITEIGRDAFYNCTSLTCVELNDKVTNIDLLAFYNCSKLEKIVVPRTLTHIGSSAFSSCTSLKDFYCLADQMPSIESNSFYQSNYKNAILWVWRSLLDDYKSTSPWRFFGEIRPIDGSDDIPSINNSADTLIQRYSVDGTKNVRKKGLQILKRQNGSTYKVMLK